MSGDVMSFEAPPGLGNLLQTTRPFLFLTLLKSKEATIFKSNVSLSKEYPG